MIERTLTAGFALLVLAVRADAQGTDLVHEGPAIDAGLGYSVAGLDDVDGDGIPDYLLGSMGCTSVNAGFAEVRSGSTGALIRRHEGNGCYGMNVARLFDVDGDGVDDYSVSAVRADNSLTLRGGIVEIISGASGVLLHVLEGDSPNARFGYVVDHIQDLDGDGQREVFVASPWDSAVIDEAGSVDVFSLNTGAALLHLDGDAPDAWFGFGSAVVDDVDGDGVQDLALGTPVRWYTPTGLEPAGRLEVRSAVDGSLVWTRAGLVDGDHYGVSVKPIADQNGDGRPELIVGAPWHTVPFHGDPALEVGRVELLSGADGALLHSFEGLPKSKYGAAVHAAGDLDGDGFEDLVIGACYCQTSGPLDPGAGFIEWRSGQTGALLERFVQGGDFSSFGWSVAPVGDLNADGIPEVLAGEPFGDALGYKTGRVTVFSGGALTLRGSPLEISAQAGGVQSLTLDAGPEHAGELFLLLGSLSGIAPGVALGQVVLPLTLDSFLLDSAASPNAWLVSPGIGLLDANGRAAASAQVPEGLLNAGLTVHHAFLAIAPDGELTLASTPFPLVLVD